MYDILNNRLRSFTVRSWGQRLEKLESSFREKRGMFTYLHCCSSLRPVCALCKYNEECLLKGMSH